MCEELAVHQVNGVGALVRGEPDAAPEQIQEHVAMTGEHRSKYVSLPLVRSEPFQFFAGTAAPMIEQHCGKRPATLRAPEERVQGDRPVVYDYGFRRTKRLALSRRREGTR